MPKKGYKQTKEHRINISKSYNSKSLKNLKVEAGFKKGNAAWNKGIPHTEEHKKKLKENHVDLSKEKHWNWKGGISPENIRIRHSIEGKLWRNAVFARDNWTCQRCEQQGGKLEAHHIFNFAEYLELRFAIDNGITFCKKCHQKFHKKYGIKNNTLEQVKEFII